MKKCLITWGGWEGHEPDQCTAIIESELGATGYQVRRQKGIDCYDDEAYLKSLDLIIQCVTMEEISKERETHLLAAIRGGTNYAGWHGGMCDTYRNNINYQFMTGGQWVQHPGGVIDYTVNITGAEHPITQGLDDFSMHSEQYYMHVDPSNEVLATTTFKGNQEGMDWIAGCEMPVIWTRRYGRGRVFYTSLGHVAKDIEQHEVRTIIARGSRWAAGDL